jgi:hypothetical protein
MERDDLRAAHACWHTPSIELLRNHRGIQETYDLYRQQIHTRIEQGILADAVEIELAKQNGNPVKTVTSGLECRATETFIAGGKLRVCNRDRWWEEYRGPFSVFGHYWRAAPADFQKGPDLFAGYDLHHTLGPGDAMCMDFSVGARGLARQGSGHLAALRWPERELVFDSGDVRPIGPAMINA